MQEDIRISKQESGSLQASRRVYDPARQVRAQGQLPGPMKRRLGAVSRRVRAAAALVYCIIFRQFWLFRNYNLNIVILYIVGLASDQCRLFLQFFWSIGGVLERSGGVEAQAVFGLIRDPADVFRVRLLRLHTGAAGAVRLQEAGHDLGQLDLGDGLTNGFQGPGDVTCGLFAAADAGSAALLCVWVDRVLRREAIVLECAGLLGLVRAQLIPTERQVGERLERGAKAER